MVLVLFLKYVYRQFRVDIMLEINNKKYSNSVWYILEFDKIII